MYFFLGLTCIGTGGVLAVRAERNASTQQKMERISGLLLVAGLSLIGWGLTLRLW